MKCSSQTSTACTGRVYSLLKNWPERRVKAICLTDGERVGYLGDLGVQAVGVPISKLALYSACAGIPPNMCLPVCIDAGGLSSTAWWLLQRVPPAQYKTERLKLSLLKSLLYELTSGYPWEMSCRSCL